MNRARRTAETFVTNTAQRPYRDIRGGAVSRRQTYASTPSSAWLQSGPWTMTAAAATQRAKSQTNEPTVQDTDT